MWSLGQKVEARFRGKARFYEGIIQSVHKNGTYDVKYSDGDIEVEVASELIRNIPPGDITCADELNSEDRNCGTAPTHGDRELGTNLEREMLDTELKSPGKREICSILNDRCVILRFLSSR